MLATTVQEHPFEWESHLAKVCMAYNSSTHPATGYRPFFLMFGYQAKLPVDIVYGAPQDGSTHTDYAANLTKALNKAFLNARAKMGTVAQRQKELYHHKVHAWKTVRRRGPSLAPQPGSAPRAVEEAVLPMDRPLPGGEMTV